MYIHCLGMKETQFCGKLDRLEWKEMKSSYLYCIFLTSSYMELKRTVGMYLSPKLGNITFSINNHKTDKLETGIV